MRFENRSRTWALDYLLWEDCISRADALRLFLSIQIFYFKTLVGHSLGSGLLMDMDFDGFEEMTG